jgi:hypothetical protein
MCLPGTGGLFWAVENLAIPALVTESQADPSAGNRFDVGTSLRSGYAQPSAGSRVIHPD